MGDEPVDRLGDLQLPSPGRFQLPHGFVHCRREEVDADEREVAFGLLWLFFQPDDFTGVIQLGDTELARIRVFGSA